MADREYTIYPLHLGDIERQKITMAYLREPGRVLRLPVLAWYLTDGKQHIMVDNGGTAPDYRYQPYTRTPEQSPAEALGRLGVKPEDIGHVILTHLHWDHAGNNRLFKNAKIYVQKSELEYAAKPLEIQRNSYDSQLVIKTDYTLLESECEILPGISVIITPGHSPGSQSVVVDTREGKYLIAGDHIALYENVEKKPYIPNGVHTNLVEYACALDRVMALGYRILAGHDPETLRHKCFPPQE